MARPPTRVGRHPDKTCARPRRAPCMLSGCRSSTLFLTVGFLYTRGDLVTAISLLFDDLCADTEIASLGDRCRCRRQGNGACPKKDEVISPGDRTEEIFGKVREYSAVSVHEPGG